MRIFVAWRASVGRLLRIGTKGFKINMIKVILKTKDCLEWEEERWESWLIS